MVPLHELSDDMAAAIASVEIDEYGKVKYKLWDKGAAQEKLAKYLGLYAKDNEQAGKALGAAVKELNDSERAVRMARMFEGNPGALVAMLQSFAQKAKA